MNKILVGLDFVEQKLTVLESRLTFIETELKKRGDTILLNRISLALSDVIAAKAEVQKQR